MRTLLLLLLLCVAAPVVAAEPVEALAEVNTYRARRGLRPFVLSPGLTRAAKACAKYRADRLMEGHTRNDFAYVPGNTYATAAGCGAAMDHWGWLTCCAAGHYRVAGAAWCRGRDGQRYMHLFVR